MAKPKYCGEDVICLISGQPNGDIHHVVTRKAGGSDDPCNMMPLAHRYHQEIHNIGLNRFAQKYPGVEMWLIKHGWENDGHKWWPPAAARRVNS